MDFGISGKTAFVAGGSKGIGRAAAEILAAEGCRVGLVARGQAGIDVVVDGIRKSGGTAIGVSADLNTREGTEKAVAAVTKAFGDPDIVVGQTSDMTFQKFFDTKDEDYERIFRIFTMSQVYLARATLPAMQKKKWGRYIHIGALVSKEPHFFFPHILHTTVRPSTVGFMRSLAEEVAGDGVTINVVGPGYILTDTMAGYLAGQLGMSLEALYTEIEKDNEADRQKWMIEPVPANRNGKTEEVGALIAFLASRQAGYITGEFITVDGGMHRFAF